MQRSLEEYLLKMERANSLTHGASYTIGVLFYRWASLPYHHAIWHLFVLGGSICHYVAVWLVV